MLEDNFQNAQKIFKYLDTNIYLGKACEMPKETTLQNGSKTLHTFCSKFVLTHSLPLYTFWNVLSNETFNQTGQAKCTSVCVQMKRVRKKLGPAKQKGINTQS